MEVMVVVRHQRTSLKRVIEEGVHVMDVPVCHCEQCSMSCAGSSAAKRNG